MRFRHIDLQVSDVDASPLWKLVPVSGKNSMRQENTGGGKKREALHPVFTSNPLKCVFFRIGRVPALGFR
jgi:hypothetical protein